VPHAAQTVHAVVIKPSGDEDDQMGLLIDKPGNLITVEDDEILPLPLTAEAEERRYLSGIAEVRGTLYRIISVDAIISRFKGERLSIMEEGTDK